MIDAVSSLVLAIEEDREGDIEPRSVEDLAFDVALEYGITARELLVEYYKHYKGEIDGDA